MGSEKLRGDILKQKISTEDAWLGCSRCSCMLWLTGQRLRFINVQYSINNSMKVYD